MDVAIRRDFLMLAHIGILQSKSDDLAFFIDGESANEHNVTRKIGNFCVQVNQAILAGP